MASEAIGVNTMLNKFNAAVQALSGPNPDITIIEAAFDDIYLNHKDDLYWNFKLVGPGRALGFFDIAIQFGRNDWGITLREIMLKVYQEIDRAAGYRLDIGEFSNAKTLYHHGFSKRLYSYWDDFSLAKDMAEVDGLILEFGVWKGSSINKISYFWPDKTIYGFDSFEGFEEDWVLTEGVYGIKADYTSLNGQLPEVRQNVQLVKGWIDDTLPGWWDENQGEIEFLNIDVDLYAPTKTILETLNDGIKPGSIIRFDELTDFTLFPGDQELTRPFYLDYRDHEWKALNEWANTYDREVKPIARNWYCGSMVLVTK